MTANDLLTTQDIADLYRVSYTHARDVLTKHKGFPRPIPASSKKKPLWLKDTIEAFIRGESTHK